MVSFMPCVFIAIVRAGVRPSPFALAGLAIYNIPNNTTSSMNIRTGMGFLARIGVESPVMMMMVTWSAEFREIVAKLLKAVLVFGFPRLT